MNYQIVLKYNGGQINDYFDTKREVIQWIAEEMEVTQVSIKDDVNARDDSIIFRDSAGWRAYISYSPALFG